MGRKGGAGKAAAESHGSCSVSGTCVDDLIAALRDERVLAALGSLFDSRLQLAMQTIAELKGENQRHNEEIEKLKFELQAANTQIAALESYSRVDNLIISGLPVASFNDAVSATAETPASNNKAVEKAVIELCNSLRLPQPITEADISTAHRLKSRGNGPAPVIVRFTTRKAKDAVYSARRQLKSNPTERIFINEDLTKTVAELFKQARQCIKEKRLFSAWTHGGHLYVKKTSDAGCRAKKITCLSELLTASN